MSLLPIQMTAETILWQQKELNTSQSEAAVFSLETVKLPSCLMPKAPIWRHPTTQEKGSEPSLPQWGWDVAGGWQVYGSHPSALCNYLHALSSPLDSFEVCSYDIFLSAKKLQLQLKVTSYWEWGSLLVFLCETSIKPGVSVCTYPSGTKLPSFCLLH